jgi:hypothetical protein
MTYLNIDLGIRCCQNLHKIKIYDIIKMSKKCQKKFIMPFDQPQSQESKTLILSISETLKERGLKATPENIKSVNREIAKKVHPDTSGYESADQFNDLNAEYRTLIEAENIKESSNEEPYQKECRDDIINARASHTPQGQSLKDVARNMGIPVYDGPPKNLRDVARNMGIKSEFKPNESLRELAERMKREGKI